MLGDFVWLVCVLGGLVVFGFGPLLAFCVFGIPVVWLPVYLSVYGQLFAVGLMLVLVFYGFD